MSSRPAEPGRDRGARPTLSLTSRVTGLVSLVGFSVLLLATLLPYLFLSRSLNREQTGWLTDRIDEFGTVLRDDPGRFDLLEGEVRRETEKGRPRRFYARVLHADGTPLVTTRGMDERLPASGFPAPVARDGQPRGLPMQGRDGRSYLEMAKWTRLGAGPDDRGVLQVALDVTQDKVLLAKYRRSAVVVFIFGLLLCVAGGVYVARTGLRPLTEITELAKRIGPERLDERLGRVRWPTELASMAAVFDGMLQRLQDAFRKLSQFSADIAHEFRTPLSNLRTEAEVTLAHPRSVQHYQEVLGSSLEEFEHLSRVIDGLLFLARAEAGGPPLSREDLDVRAEIEAVAQFFGPLADERGIGLAFEGEGFLYADRTLLRRALANLLSNAIEHTPPGGKVTISAAFSGGSAEICVNDTGCGIAPDHVPRVFDRFYRVESSRRGASGGSGLGLSLVRSIAELHGGTVSLRSCEGAGTSVTLIFPVTRPTGTG